jgi:hypothetical protein
VRGRRLREPLDLVPEAPAEDLRELRVLTTALAGAAPPAVRQGHRLGGGIRAKPGHVHGERVGLVRRGWAARSLLIHHVVSERSATLSPNQARNGESAPSLAGGRSAAACTML